MTNDSLQFNIGNKELFVIQGGDGIDFRDDAVTLHKTEHEYVKEGRLVDLIAARAVLNNYPGTNTPPTERWSNQVGLPAVLYNFAFNEVSGWVGSGVGSSPYALRFDGTTTWCYLDYTPVANNFTIETWIRTSQTHQIDTQNTIGSAPGVSGQRYLFYPTRYTQASGDAGVGVSVGTNGVSVYENAEYHMPATAVYNAALGSGVLHVVIVYIDKQPHIFVNGVLVHVGLRSIKNNVWSPLCLGGTPGGYGWFGGEVIMARIYGRPLAPEEVNNNFTAGELLFSYTTEPQIISTVGGIDCSTMQSLVSVTASADIPTGSQVRYLISFDEQQTWYTYAETWIEVSLTDIHTTGMTQEDLALVPWMDMFIPGVTPSLNFAVGLSTSDQKVSPAVRSIIVNYQGQGRGLILSKSIQALHTPCIEIAGGQVFEEYKIEQFYYDVLPGLLLASPYSSTLVDITEFSAVEVIQDSDIKVTNPPQPAVNLPSVEVGQILDTEPIGGAFTHTEFLIETFKKKPADAVIISQPVGILDISAVFISDFVSFDDDTTWVGPRADGVILPSLLNGHLDYSVFLTAQTDTEYNATLKQEDEVIHKSVLRFNDVTGPFFVKSSPDIVIDDNGLRLDSRYIITQQIGWYDNLAKIAISAHTNYVIDINGDLYGWGYGENGQLLNQWANQYSPTKLPINDVVAVWAGGYRCFALKRDGTLWTWGYTHYGACGTGYTGETSYSTPQQVSIPAGVVQISTSYYHTLFLMKDGSVWGTGYNNYSQATGNGNTSHIGTPQRITALGYDNVQVEAGGHSSFVLKRNGQVYCWGFGAWGKLGLGSTSNQYYPTLNPYLSDIVKISASYYHTLFLRNDGRVFCCGYNSHGQARGDGISNSSNVLTPIMASLTDVVDITAGTYTNRTSQALKADGRVYSWGDNSYGQFGNGTTSSAFQSIPQLMTSVSGVVRLLAGRYHAVMVKDTGYVYTVGYNNYGQIGNGGTGNISTCYQTSVICSVSSNYNDYIAYDQYPCQWYTRQDFLASGILSNLTCPSSNTLVISSGSSGTRESYSIDISSLGKARDVIITWHEHCPAGTSVEMYIMISTDKGETWPATWTRVANGQSILLQGTSLEDVYIKTKQVLQGTVDLTPTVSDIIITVIKEDDINQRAVITDKYHLDTSKAINIKGIDMVTKEPLGTHLFYLVSFDKRKTWYAHINGRWRQVSLEDICHIQKTWLDFTDTHGFVPEDPVLTEFDNGRVSLASVQVTAPYIFTFNDAGLLNGIDDKVVVDGTMYLKNDYTLNLAKKEVLAGKNVLSTVIDREPFEVIETIKLI